MLILVADPSVLMGETVYIRRYFYILLHTYLDTYIYTYMNTHRYCFRNFIHIHRHIGNYKHEYACMLHGRINIQERCLQYSSYERRIFSQYKSLTISAYSSKIANHYYSHFCINYYQPLLSVTVIFQLLLAIILIIILIHYHH